MKPSVPDPDALDAAIDRLLAGDDTADPAATHVRQWLRRAVPDEKARAHVAALRAVSPERSPEPDPKLSTGEIVPLAPRRRRRGRATLVAAVAAAVALTLGSGTALAAASGAKPGDALYGVKRFSERVALALPRSAEAEAALRLTFAERRLGEIDALAADGKDVSALVDDFSDELEAAGPSAAADRLERLLARAQERIAHLNAILDAAPQQARSGLERAIENVQRQTDKAQQKWQQKQDRDAGKDAGKDAGEGGSPERTESPGRSGDAPGRSGDAPGNSGGEHGGGSKSGSGSKGGHSGG